MECGANYFMEILKTKTSMLVQGNKYKISVNLQLMHSFVPTPNKKQ